MKKIITTFIATSLVAAGTLAEVDVTMDFASAYVFRGVTFNDGAVFQPGIEASGLGLPEEYGAVAVGAWGNYDIDDYGGLLNSSEFSEVDWYASYSLPALVDGLDLFVGYCEYTYPMGSTADKEANFGLGYEIAGVGLGATAYFNVGGGDTDFYYELAAEYGLSLAEGLDASVGASAGYFEPENGDSGFADGTVSVGVSYALTDVWSLGLTGIYIAQLDDDILVDETLAVDPVDGYGYDVDFVGVLSIGASL